MPIKVNEDCCDTGSLGNSTTISSSSSNNTNNDDERMLLSRRCPSTGNFGKLSATTTTSAATSVMGVDDTINRIRTLKQQPQQQRRRRQRNSDYEHDDDDHDLGDGTSNHSHDANSTGSCHRRRSIVAAAATRDDNDNDDDDDSSSVHSTHRRRRRNSPPTPSTPARDTVSCSYDDDSSSEDLKGDVESRVFLPVAPSPSKTKSLSSSVSSSSRAIGTSIRHHLGRLSNAMSSNNNKKSSSREKPVLPLNTVSSSSIPSNSSSAANGSNGIDSVNASTGTHYRSSPERKTVSLSVIEGSSSTNSASNNSSNTQGTTSTASSTAFFQLLFGAAGIFVTYLYYGNVQEDLFRYRDPVDGSSFTFVWFLQLAESSVTILIGYFGRYYTHRNLPPSKQLTIQQQTLPTFLFFQSGTCQLLGKALMAMSLAAGLSFPVVVLAKSAKVVPVMLGQFVLGGSSYSLHDYLFAVLIVAGTALLSFGSSTDDPDINEGVNVDEKSAQAAAVVSHLSNKNTSLGLILIFMSLIMDGVTGGLQKKLKRETANMVVTTYDFLFYSHVAMFTVAFVISLTTGEFFRGHLFLTKHLKTSESNVLYLLVASCICSSIGQCFIFYVIATFDPLVCTTVTTTRKMASVLYSILFKGHHLSYQGIIGLFLGIAALCIEMEQQLMKKRGNNNNSNTRPSNSNTTTNSKVGSILPTTTTAQTIVSDTVGASTTAPSSLPAMIPSSSLVLSSSSTTTTGTTSAAAAAGPLSSSTISTMKHRYAS